MSPRHPTSSPLSSGAPRVRRCRKEKAHTRARDAMAAERRRMPMIRVEKDYRFTAPGGGDATLLDLFDGSRQLVVYRFFMDPDMGATRSAAAPAARCTPTS